MKPQFLPLMLILLAGCLAGPATPPQASEPEQVAPPLVLDACRAVGGRFPMPADIMAGSLPPGFTLVGSGPTTILEILAFDCDIGEERNRAMIGSFFVIPPPEYQAEGIDHYTMTDGAFVEGRLADFFPANFSDMIESRFPIDIRLQQQVVAFVGNTSVVQPIGGNYVDFVVPTTQTAPRAGQTRAFIQDIGQSLLVGSYDMALSGGFYDGGAALASQGVPPGTGLVCLDCSMELSKLTLLNVSYPGCCQQTPLGLRQRT